MVRVLPKAIFRSIALALCFLPALGVAQSAADPLRAEVERMQASAQTGSVPPGALASIAYQLDVADRIQKDYPDQAMQWRARARDWLKLASQGKDPVMNAQGQIIMRGYDSPISSVRQGYAIYLPKNYDPKRAYPLMIALHGGSANGNLFLGVLLGNNMNWKEYDRHLWDEFTPKWSPEWIVVAPDGFGQVMWRFMGEQDVLDVIADVHKHYRVDDDRTVLCGLSNGGVGAYSLGMRHAWRFSAVLAIAGAPSWVQYARAEEDPLQAEALQRISGMSLAENAINTDFRYFHGYSDPGPMRPAYVAAFSKQIATLGVPYREKWFDTGHDLLYLVHRHGLVFGELEGIVRNRRPKEVRVVAGDYLANRQHWVTLTRIRKVPQLARVRAVAEGDRIVIETVNTSALALTLADVPLDASDSLRVEIDGKPVYSGSRRAHSATLELSQDGTQWRVGSPATAASGFEKLPGTAGPITDAYYGPIAHVYGTGDPALTPKLRRSAERGAKGWPLWLWRVEQRVLADSEVTDEIMRTHHLVLYATPRTNSVLTRIQDSLPLRVDAQGVLLGDRRFTGEGVGTKFIHPNPLARDRYVIVQAAPTADAVSGGHNLPDFLPDYVVYDARTTRSRPRLIFPMAQRPLAYGYFDARWQIDPTHARSLPAAGPKLANGRLAAPVDSHSSPNAPRPPRPTGPMDTARQRESPIRTARQDQLPGRTAREGQPINEGNGPESADESVPRSKLPVPVCPPAPAPPTTFAATEDTQAGKVAREIARRVTTFLNYRGKIPGATWTIDDQSTWSVRDETTCLAALPTLGVDVEPWTGRLSTPVPVPVRLRTEVAGVSFRFMHAGPGVVLSCEMAARLADIAAIVKRHGVHTVYVLSAYRDHPYTSFHTLGLALDLSRFDTDDGPLIVKTDFVMDRNRETCDPQFPPPKAPKAQKLHEIACELAASKRFSSVLTPNYNAGHRDHFHLDIRPNDPRLFVR